MTLAGNLPVAVPKHRRVGGGFGVPSGPRYTCRGFVAMRSPSARAAGRDAHPSGPASAGSSGHREL